MSDADRERWNARYASGEYAARTHPSPLLAAWIDRLPRGRALDVACGLGRNAIHLAANGFAVDAMDISGVALAGARRRAESAGVAVNWIETDLERPDIARDAYDVIVVARFLDRPLIPSLVDALRPGGHIVYEHHYISPVDVGGPSSRRFRARPNELLERFRALRVLSFEEGLVDDPDGSRMALARLVACKGSPGY
ncbi:MAG: methyltransferase domain-containing protein [Chromatiales bacterium]|nr:methyltransferase domain-containing protein [Chromatiales bacterium]